MTAKQCGVSLNLVTEGPQAQSLSPSVTWDSYDVKRNPDFKVGKRRNDDFPAYHTDPSATFDDAVGGG
ncbi:hypothetical protein AAC387_Pa10g1443 [Persea americana]